MKNSAKVSFLKAIPIVLAASFVMWGAPSPGHAQTNGCPTISATGAGTFNDPSKVIIGGNVFSTVAGSWEYSVVETTTAVCGPTTISLPAGEFTLPQCPVGSLPEGTHTISILLKAADGTTCGESVVVIIDETAPALEPVAEPNILWPPNNKLVPVVVTPNASDTTSGIDSVTASVVSSEPVKIVGTARKSKIKWDSPVYNNDGTITFNLPAQRLGKNRGRVYTITVTATDLAGNESETAIEVKVPHDQSKKIKKK